MAYIRQYTACLLLYCFSVLPASAWADAWLIEVTGAIGPATADHMIRGLEQAEASGAELVILRIDTPGGLDNAMRDMIKAILAANTPVLGYVAPSGARAASAGTYLLYATHVAAMAPGTNLGAATPVQLGSPGVPRMPDSKEEGDSAEEAPQPGTAMERKSSTTPWPTSKVSPSCAVATSSGLQKRCGRGPASRLKMPSPRAS